MTSAYAAQLDEKNRRLQHLLAPYFNGEISVFPSAPRHYRMRAEFRIWQEESACFYAMSPRGESIRRDNLIKIDSFPPACVRINALMPLLLEAVNADPVLRHKLFQAEFLAAGTDDALITLIYHRRLDEAWENIARDLQTQLQVPVIGRSRGQKIVLSRDYVRECLRVFGEDFHYIQIEQGFSQPNAQVCEKMLEWAVSQAGDVPQGDLLELYCGNGNFTLPLSRCFRRVLATEISKSGITALQENIRLNQAENIAVARLSAQELAAALAGRRTFRRLQQAQIQLQDYRFSTVFVDPPRAGIDDDTLALLQTFPRIIYISCNPETLAQNLQILCQNHKIRAAALFDQFPFTPHIESGVVLERHDSAVK